jgi:hypothetical protein
MNKRGLQIAMALLGAIPVLTGIIGMFGLSDPFYASVGIPANATAPLRRVSMRFQFWSQIREVEKTCAQQTSKPLASAVWTTYLGSKR